MVKLEGTFRVHIVKQLLLKQGLMCQIAHNYVQIAFEYLQGWTSVDNLMVLGHLHSVCDLWLCHCGRLNLVSLDPAFRYLLHYISDISCP